MIQSFRDLTVWHKGIDLVVRVYSFTQSFPRSELYGLTSQMQRASVSIPSNIAEGKAIGGRGYLRHLRIALGSEAELQTHIEIATRLKLIAPNEAEKLLNETSQVGKMLTSLLRSLRPLRANDPTA